MELVYYLLLSLIKIHLSLFSFFLFFLDQLTRIHAYTCKVSPARNKCEVKWVLDDPNPCKCTNVVMGGFTTWNSQLTPGHAENPLLSDDISTIRMHYGIECEEQSKCFDCFSTERLMLNWKLFRSDSLDAIFHLFNRGWMCVCMGVCGSVWCVGCVRVPGVGGCVKSLESIIKKIIINHVYLCTRQH